MAQRWFGKMSLAVFTVAGVGSLLGAMSPTGPRPTVHVYVMRQGVDDLEVTGLPAYPIAYVRLSDLMRLPLVHRTVADDPDYPGVTLHVTGVYLDALARALGAPSSDDLIDAFCTDKYRSHYPADFIAQHHPIFVVKVDGLSPAAWAAKNHQYDPGPYLIAYAHFVPSFQVLSHKDEPQLPTNIIRLNFSTTALTYGAITPPGSYPEGSPVEQGFTIAKQNCFRCHFSGPYGGTKSGETWMTLSRKALHHPQDFSEYIRDPRQENPQAEMPGNPQYDDATRAALTAYFRTFADAATPKESKPK